MESEIFNMQFPPEYTEEEEMLMKKYQELRRVKRELQLSKTPNQEPDQDQGSKPDAKEVAMQLLKSGAISAIKVENKERHGFKRSKASQRKRSLNDRAEAIGYEPFEASHPTHDSETAGTTASTSQPAVKSLRECFVSGVSLDDPKHLEALSDCGPEEPQHEDTLSVHGAGVSVDLLRAAFAPFGTLLHISMLLDKNCAFVTFEKTESAEKAVSEMNGATVSGIKLQVSFAEKAASDSSAD